MGADYFEQYEECSVRTSGPATAPAACSAMKRRPAPLPGHDSGRAPPPLLPASQALPGCIPIGIGAGTTIKKAIVDKNARIGMDCQIINKDGVMEANREEQFYVIKAREEGGEERETRPASNLPLPQPCQFRGRADPSRSRLP